MLSVCGVCNAMFACSVVCCWCLFVLAVCCSHYCMVVRGLVWDWLLCLMLRVCSCSCFLEILGGEGGIACVVVGVSCLCCLFAL